MALVVQAPALGGARRFCGAPGFRRRGCGFDQCCQPGAGIRAAGPPRNGFDAGGDDESARWNTYYRSSTDGGAAWSPEVKLSAFVPGYGYKFAEPMDGYLEPYGDYFELDVDGLGTTHALWGEGPSYSGPGNVWYARI